MSLRRSGVTHVALFLALLVVGCLVVLEATDADGAFAAWCATWLDAVGMFFAAVVAFSRQGPRSLVAWALASGTAAGLLAAVLYRNDPSPPYPSLADPLFLAVYPLAAGALVQYARRHRLRLSSGSWIDGLTTACLTAALWALVVLEPLRATTPNASLSDLVLTLAYPVADLLLVSTLAAVWALRGWRLDRCLALFGGAILLYATADSFWTLRLAQGQDGHDNLIVAAYGLAFVALSLTSLESSPLDRRRQPRSASVLPALLGLSGTGVLVLSALGDAEALPMAFAGIATVLAALRFAVTSIDNANLLTASRNDAATDPLTGLGNRRALAAQLDRRLAGGEPFTYLCLDLNRFKTYNDQFGHAAGDALLAGMGRALAAATLGFGSAFRPGGDEFCALITGCLRPGDPTFDAVIAALTEDSVGFSIDPSCGIVHLPRETSDADFAQRLGDQRMYLDKREGKPARSPAAEETSEALFSQT
jgi:diguanylate cyclase (GGDEF)-like protein